MQILCNLNGLSLNFLYSYAMIRVGFIGILRGDKMAIRSDGLRTRNRILTTCVRLFLEQGYHATTMQQISKEARVSSGSFFNLFSSKDGVLLELLHFMFQNQFGMARSTTGAALPPVYVYAVETATQITLTELNENLRDIYIEAYTAHQTLMAIQDATAKENYQIFGSYQPELTEADFKALDYCSAGIMRGCMVNPCTEEYTLEKKLHTFLTSSLRMYKVPEDEIQRVTDYVLGLDIRAISQQVMEELFRQLAMRYSFSLEKLLPESEKA